MYEWLRETMAGTLHLPVDLIRPDATVEEVGLDSLAVTELVLIAQDELGISVDESRLTGLRTVGDIADFLQRHAQPVAG
ncbi:acyl carrier protein [Streptomyces sp. NPDC093546]|uniref:acyl carrier protein n=1 Tax=Streptomyces sp. NPDC093546 TaxID=3366040 RepID=UPI0038255549